MRRSLLIAGTSREFGLSNPKVHQADCDRATTICRSASAPGDLLSALCGIRQCDGVGATFATIEEQHGPVQVLVSNTGNPLRRLPLTTAEDDFASALESNLTGTDRVAQLATCRTIRRRGGRTLCACSTPAFHGLLGPSGYTGSTTGLIGFAPSLAHELAPHSRTLDTLFLGMTIAAMLDAPGTEDIEGLATQMPLTRLARHPNGILRAVLFLTSPRRPPTSRSKSSRRRRRAHEALNSHPAARTGWTTRTRT
ncbi:SDR family NAD(P)-dependent oxidoreductase [Kitasatospora sp. NPDC058046]|uniref:SDR family NAD(P)-dependent oxidoreductase n=1 Tax=Kitasatospora sp. NPDC058046 TaxID=3346312 RepID=UPI0036D872B2